MPLNLRLTPAELAFQLRDSGARHLLVSQPRRGAWPCALTAVRHHESSASSNSSRPGRRDCQRPMSPRPPPCETHASTSTRRTPSSTPPAPPAGPRARCSRSATTSGAPPAPPTTSACTRTTAGWPCCPCSTSAASRSSCAASSTAPPPSCTRASTPPRANRAIDDDGVTIVSVVANMLQRMLDERGDRPYPASLRCVLLGGGPAPEPLLDAAQRIGVPVVQTYGLTEAASQVATLAPEDALPKLGSAGKPLFGTEVRIVDDHGSHAAAGEAGEIVVRGPTVIAGLPQPPRGVGAGPARRLAAHRRHRLPGRRGLPLRPRPPRRPHRLRRRKRLPRRDRGRPAVPPGRRGSRRLGHRRTRAGARRP